MADVRTELPTESFEYEAFLFRQTPGSPLQVAFVAASCDIEAWARVPTKTTGNVRNFQRAQLASHITEVERFFSRPKNASPTAVVVGFDPSRAVGRVGLFDRDGRDIDAAQIAEGRPVQGKIVIRTWTDTDPQGRKDMTTFLLARAPLLTDFIAAELIDILGLSAGDVATLRAEFDKRAVEGDPLLADTLEPEDTEDGDESAQESVPADEEPFTLSNQSEKILAGKTPSERALAAARLEFVAQLQEAALARLSDTELIELKRLVQDELKPALLIDGQHRVLGSSKRGEVPFLVCAMPDALWPELAFQFLVTNRTAKRVKESLLINIVGNSLSKVQRASIEDRLRDAGIRIGLIEAVMRVHEDEQSPFYHQLAFGLTNESGFLDAAAMRNKVIRLWFERMYPIDQLFDHMCQGKLKRDKTDYWKSEEVWFGLFLSFWGAVRDRYNGSQVFSFELSNKELKNPVSRLMTATVLKIFQETILEYVFKYVSQKAQMDEITIAASLPDNATFTEKVSNTLEPLAPEFFQGWTITGFDGSKGARDDLSEAIRQVISKEKRIAELKNPAKPHRLFKE